MSGRRPRVDPALHYDISAWLSWEAELLDHRLFQDWLRLLADDIAYRMPVQVTTAAGRVGPILGDMMHFAEDRYTLGLRVERLMGRHAWTEDPPSRTRRFVTNIRVTPPSGALRLADLREVEVRSYLLLFRSRGDEREADIISAERTVILRRPPVGAAAAVPGHGDDTDTDDHTDDWRLARRHIDVDEAVLRTQNLAVLL